MANGLVDKADVRAQLSIARVFQARGVELAGKGVERRATVCPSCGPRSGPSTTVNVRTNVWHCHVCNAGGDAIAAVAAFDRLTDFQATLATAAELAGLQPNEPTASRVGRRAEWEQISAELAEADEARRAAAAEQIPAQWEGLQRWDDRGARYLASRLKNAAEAQSLIDRGVVRFMRNGNVALPLRDLETGQVVGIQHRAIDGSLPKVWSVKGSRVSGTALHGRVTDIDPCSVDIAVIVEGLVDTLHACLEFPGSAIYGAAGVSQMAVIAAAVAPSVAAARGWMIIVPDVDRGTGEAGAAKAALAAEAAGLSLEQRILFVDVRPFHDLADARCAGWEWSWPR